MPRFENRITVTPPLEAGANAYAIDLTPAVSVMLELAHLETASNVVETAADQQAKACEAGQSTPFHCGLQLLDPDSSTERLEIACMVPICLGRQALTDGRTTLATPASRAVSGAVTRLHKMLNRPRQRVWR